MLLCRFLCSYFTTISVPSNHYRDLVPVLSARKWHGIALSLSARPPCIMGSIKLSRQSVANKQALPCWPTAPSFPLQVSGHDSLTVQSLLTQTGELPNTRWLDSCANPLARPLLQAWAWSPTFFVENQGVQVLVSSPHLRLRRIALCAKGVSSPIFCDFKDPLFDPPP